MMDGTITAPTQVLCSDMSVPCSISSLHPKTQQKPESTKDHILCQGHVVTLKY